MRRRHARALRPAIESLDDRCLLSGLTPAQVTSAYGLNAVTINVSGTAVKANGAGQLITVIEAYHDPYLAADLATFDAAYNLPPAAIAQVNLAGSATDSGWAGEETLDVEWAHALAPEAGIVVIEAASASTQDLLNAVNLARAIPPISVVSMSWGAGEFQGQTSLDGYFTTPAGHQGMTFVAASGDSGVQGGAEWPASSPNVLSVGGTTLRISASGAYQSESVWSGSSGGTSAFEPEPAYQRSVQSTRARTTPDVSFDGDPNTGVMVYTTDPSTGRGSWQQVGGTSLGAPAWAAVIAIADEGRLFAGKGTLNGPTQTLPALYSLPSSDFHAVATTTVVVGRFPFTYVTTSASPGLGSPNGAAIVNGLIAYGTSTSVRAAVTTAAVSPTTTRSPRARTVSQLATSVSPTDWTVVPETTTAFNMTEGSRRSGSQVANRL